MSEHVTRAGEKIEIADMSDRHLLNTMKLLKKKAENGIVVISGGGHFADDIWCDEEELSEKEALDYLGYYHYANEAKKRGLI